MSTSNNHGTKRVPASPFDAWQAGFNYAFGFQIKLIYGLFGLNPDRKKEV